MGRLAAHVAIEVGCRNYPRRRLAPSARDRAGDAWFRVALLSSLNDTASDFFHLYLSRNKFQLNPLFLNQLAALIGAQL